MTYVDRTLTTTPTLSLAAQTTTRPLPPANDYPELAPLLSVLFLMLADNRSVVVNITAAHAGAGTSTVARRVAAAAAATGWCRVALLNADPHADEPGDGLLDAVERGQTPVLVPERLGPVEVDAGRLYLAGRSCSRVDDVRKLYGALRDRYSLVIVDCAPVLACQQTLTVAAAADETVLVVETERTALADVGRARAALERRGAGVLGLVMNKSRTRARPPFGRRA